MRTNNNANQTTKTLKSLKRLHIFAYAFLLVSSIILFGNNHDAYGQINEDDLRYEDTYTNNIEEEIEEKQSDEITSESEEEQTLAADYDEHQSTINYLKENGFDANDDLGDHINLTVDDMNRIIEFYDNEIETGFTGQGEVFIKASQESGLSPIYIFAHAACESSYGTSYLAINKGNYFGINAVDADPNAAYEMGSTLEQGIVAGAVWIKTNYYDNGYTTLQSMKDAGYATSNTWVSNISSIANTSIGAI